MVSHKMIEPKRKRSFVCIWLSSAILLSTVFFIGTSLLLSDYKKRFLGCNMHQLVVTKSKICEKECSLDGTEALPKGIVMRTTDLEMRPLWGSPKKKSKSPMDLLALAVGIKQKQNVDKIVKKVAKTFHLLKINSSSLNIFSRLIQFRITDFVVMLFHYDGNVDEWKDLEWSDSAVHVSAINQTKWWFAKRFLHPDIIAAYDYVFLWDEDLGVEHFHVGRYLSIVKKEGLQISQPAIDAEKSEVHYKLTAREINSTVHRKAVNIRGKVPTCFENSMEPPCTGFVEMMAPVFSRESWRCAWHMVQNDLVHGWGLDFQLGYCAHGNRSENVGVVDSEYLIHLGIPSLGGSAGGKTNAEVDRLASMASAVDESDGRTAVRKVSFKELDKFKNRWRKAVKEDECWVDPFHQSS